MSGKASALLDPEELRGDPYLRALAELAARSGVGPLYLVGGYLRDRLSSQAPRSKIELDLVMWGEAPPFARELAEAGNGTLIPLDRDTIRALVSLAGATVQIDISRPKGDTIDADLAARDFTVNAIAMKIDPGLQNATMTIFDPTGGLDDLRWGRLRAVTPSAFAQDPLRMIRAVRLATQLDFTIEESTQVAIIERAPLLGTVAGERVRDELFRIIERAPAAPSIQSLDHLRLLKVLVPEIEAIKAVPASPPHRLPLWEHSLETLRSAELLLGSLGDLFPDDVSWLSERLERELEAGITEAAILKLAALLHDIGKPETRTVQPDGRVRFLGHEEAGLPIAARLCERLRLGKQASALIQQIVRQHLRPLHLSREATVTERAKYRLLRELGEAAPTVLLHSWADLRATIGEGEQELTRHERFLREALRFYQRDFLPSKTSPVLRGDELIEVFGLEPGPFVGLVLERLREAQATGLVTSRQQGLAYLHQHLLAWRATFQQPDSSGRP